MASSLLVLTPAVAAAHDGQLDPTFAGDGAIVDAITPLGQADVVTGIARQPDGKIVVVGYSDLDADPGAFQKNFAVSVARYNPDGSRDFTFTGDGGALGAFTIEVTAGNAGDIANAVAIDPATRDIVIAGEANVGPNAGGDPRRSSSTDQLIIRLTTEGFLKPTFDGPSGTGNGIVRIETANIADGARDLAIDSAGRIVLSGYIGGTDTDSITGSNFLVGRLLADGALDSDFSGDGRIAADLGAGDGFEAVAIAGDGKIVVAGQTAIATSPQDTVVGRLTTAGTFDAGFDGPAGQPAGAGNGIIVAPLAPGAAPDGAEDVATQPDGRIIVAGGALGDFALERLTAATGTRDVTFGDDGTVTTDLGGSGDRANAVALQADGKIVAAGSSGNSPQTQQVAFARYLPGEGALDPAFDGDSGQGNGRVSAPVSGAANDALIDPQGRIVVAGPTASDDQYGVVRVVGDGPPETTVVTAPPARGSDDTPTFEFVSTDPGASFECSLDGAEFTACSSPHTLAPLVVGEHTFAVRAKDGTGNLDPTPESRSFTIEAPTPPTPPPGPQDPPPGDVPPTADTTPPDTAIEEFPPRRIVTEKRRVKVRFVFSADDPESTFECSLDAAPFAPCTSPAKLKAKPGRHVFLVRALDAAGNVDQSAARKRFKIVRSS